MFDREKVRKELEERQILRREASLPPIDIEAELKVRELSAEYNERAAIFRAWQDSNPELIEKIKADVLEDLRQKKGNPDWKPYGYLSGGGYMYHVWCENAIRSKYQEVTGRLSSDL